MKSNEERNSQTLLRFLFQLSQAPKENQLFLLGDIFDFWISDGQAFYKHYKTVVDALLEFKSKGGIIYYFEGNHDFHIDRFWFDKYQIPVIDDIQYFKIDNLIVRLEHGDFINPDDIKYLNYRASIRRPWVEFIGHMLPGFFLKWLGDSLSARSRKKSNNYAIDNELQIRTMIREYAQKVYQEKPFDLLISGHMHIVDDYEIPDFKARSINLGSWFEKPRALKIEKNVVTWVDLN